MSENTPPAPALPKNISKIVTLEDFESNEISSSSCTWAQNYEELRWSCSIRKVCHEDIPTRCTYRKFQPLKQEGPTCGIVAASILLHNNVTVDDLLSQAKDNNYTINGEMFSAYNLLKLLENNIHKGNFSNPKLTLHEGSIETVDIINFLLSGGAMLVPYDAWYNHAPCLANGHKAHWALICGIIIPKGQMARVLAWHGKSRRLAIWELSDLSDSNANLNELSPTREGDDKEYYLPPGGMSGDMGLCNKCILVEGFKDDAFRVSS